MNDFIDNVGLIEAHITILLVSEFNRTRTCIKQLGELFWVNLIEKQACMQQLVNSI